MKTGIYYTPAAALSHDGCGGFLSTITNKITMGAQALNGCYQMAGLLNNRLSTDSGATHYAGSAGVREAKRLCPAAYRPTRYEKNEHRPIAEMTSAEIAEMELRIKERREWLDKIPTPTRQGKASEKVTAKIKKLGENILGNFFSERKAFNDQGWYSISQCAKLLSLGDSTVRNWYEKGFFKQQRHSAYKKAVYFKIDDVKEVKNQVYNIRFAAYTREAA